MSANLSTGVILGPLHTTGTTANNPAPSNISNIIRPHRAVNIGNSELEQERVLFHYHRNSPSSGKRFIVRAFLVHTVSKTKNVQHTVEGGCARRLQANTAGNRYASCNVRASNMFLLTSPLDGPIVPSPDNVAFFDNNSHTPALNHPVVGDQHKNEHGREATSGFRRQAKVPAGFLVRYQGGAANLLWMFRSNPTLAQHI